MAMMIGQYELTGQEEILINNIYVQFKSVFEKCELVSRKEILGIGEPNRHLLCYFVLRNDVLFVKFKSSREVLPLHDSKDMLSNIKKTIELFKNNPFVKKYKSNAYISQHSPYKDCSNVIVENEINNLLKQMHNNKCNISFDVCSNRLKNALARNRIFTIGDLVRFSANEIIAFRYLGVKSQWELCEFLTEVLNGKLQTKDTVCNLTSHPYAKLRYINEMNNRVYPVIIKDAVKTYIEKQEEYNLLYIEYINFLIKACSLKLTPREQSVFYSRLGINESSKTLQEIGDTFCLTRERIRQIFNKSARKISNKKITKFEFIELEHDKCQLIEKIVAASLGGFLAYLYFECDNVEPLKFIYSMLFNKQIELNFIAQEFKDQNRQYKETLKNTQKQAKFNLSINNLIQFKNKEAVKDEVFNRLEEERKVGTDNAALANFCYEGKIFQCESYLEKKY